MVNVVLNKEQRSRTKSRGLFDLPGKLDRDSYCNPAGLGCGVIWNTPQVSKSCFQCVRHANEDVFIALTAFTAVSQRLKQSTPLILVCLFKRRVGSKLSILINLYCVLRQSPVHVINPLDLDV